MYVYITVYVCRIVSELTKMFWKLNLNEFSCKIRCSRPQIGDLEGGQYDPLHTNRLDLNVHENRVNVTFELSAWKTMGVFIS